MIDLKLDNKEVWFAGVGIHPRCIFAYAIQTTIQMI